MVKVVARCRYLTYVLKYWSNLVCLAVHYNFDCTFDYHNEYSEQKIVHFHCGLQHRKACKRIFLEACKSALGTEIEPKKLSTFDKKTERQITLEYLGNGNYQVNADGDETGRNRRISAIAGGFVKLAEMDYIDGNDTGIMFDCGNEHASLIGLLLGRALNVRAAIREDDDSAGRGMLAAPSAQQ